MTECSNCGGEFFPAYRGQEYCSADCRRDKKKRGAPKGMKRRHYGPRFNDPSPICRVDGCQKPQEHRHHVVAAQHVDNYGGDLEDGRNCLGLCELCHTRHEKAVRRVRGSELRPENLEFAREMYLEYAEDYLARYYDMSQ